MAEEDHAELSLKGFEILFRRSPLGILISDVEGVILDANDAVVRLLGFERSEVVGRTSAELGMMSPDERDAIFKALHERGFVRDRVVRIRVKSGDIRDVMLSIDPLEQDGGLRYITTFLDVTAITRAEEQLRVASLSDELTGLCNRRGFFALADQQIKMARRPGGPSLALFFIDLDGLKALNDSRGHAAGDELLRDAGLFLRNTFREGDIVARLGGDEFLVLAGCDAPRSGDLVARVTESLRTFNAARPDRPPVEMSVGVAFFAPGSTLESMMNEADARMYEAKGKRKVAAVAKPPIHSAGSMPPRAPG